MYIEAQLSTQQLYVSIHTLVLLLEVNFFMVTLLHGSRSSHRVSLNAHEYYQKTTRSHFCMNHFPDARLIAFNSPMDVRHTRRTLATHPLDPFLMSDTSHRAFC